MDLTKSGTVAVLIPSDLMTMMGTLANLIETVIVGGESGPYARMCNPLWVKDVVRAARANGASVFVKQMGTAWARAYGMRGKAERLDELPLDLRIRELAPGLRIADRGER